MTTPAMGAVRAAFPQAEVVVAANVAVAELLSPHPLCDRVIVYDKRRQHRGIKGFLNFCSDLRKERFDLAILLQNALEAAVMVRLAQIPVRAGYNTDGRGFLLTHGVALNTTQRRLHHTDYYLKMLLKLGVSTGNHRLRLQCTQEEIAWAGKILGHGTWVAINPGAAYGSAKRWFPERFAAVADSLSRELNAAILLTGGVQEIEIGRAIERAMTNRPRNFVGKTSVRQLMALLAHCRLLITNDSGPMHVAAAFGVPIVALFGPTDYTTTSPADTSFRIVRQDVDCAPCLKRTCPKDHRCMQAITVEDVLRAAYGLLRELI